MTTGNYSDDHRVPWVGGGTIGRWETKTWNGTDDPPLPVLPKRPPSYIHRAYLGDIRNVKKIRVRLGPRERRQKKHVTMHAYHMVHESGEDELGSYKYAGTTYQFNSATHRIAGMGNVSTQLWNANDQIALINKHKEKVQGSDFNLGIVLGEGHETLRMIGDSAIRIAKSIHHLRKGDMAGGARALFEGTSRSPIRSYKSMKDFRNITEANVYARWLELQYGWRPLLQDVESGMHFIAHHVEVPRKFIVRATRRKEKKFTYHNDLNRNNDPAMVPFKAYTDSVGYIMYRKTLHVVMTPDPPSLAQQLGLLDPLSVAWELMPFSFVADWFIPVGQYLSANAYAPRMGKEVWECILQESFQTFTQSTLLPAGIRSYRWAQYDRQVGSLSAPLPAFKGFGKAASWQHCANAVALLGQIFRGKADKGNGGYYNTRVAWG